MQLEQWDSVLVFRVPVRGLKGRDDMERLTKRIEDGQAVVDCQTCKWRECDCTALACRNRIKDRLAAYEDTGLEPEEVAELAQAKQDGRLVVLPFKVGDKVWVLDYDEYGDPDDCSCWVLIGGNQKYAFLSASTEDSDDAMKICELYFEECMEYGSDILIVPWSSVYMTRDEAEAALEEQEGGSHETDTV